MKPLKARLIAVPPPAPVNPIPHSHDSQHQQQQQWDQFQRTQRVQTPLQQPSQLEGEKQQFQLPFHEQIPQLVHRQEPGRKQLGLQAPVQLPIQSQLQQPQKLQHPLPPLSVQISSPATAPIEVGKPQHVSSGLPPPPATATQKLYKAEKQKKQAKILKLEPIQVQKKILGTNEQLSTRDWRPVPRPLRGGHREKNGVELKYGGENEGKHREHREERGRKHWEDKHHREEKKHHHCQPNHHAKHGRKHRHHHHHHHHQTHDNNHRHHHYHRNKNENYYRSRSRTPTANRRDAINAIVKHHVRKLEREQRRKQLRELQDGERYERHERRESRKLEKRRERKIRRERDSARKLRKKRHGRRRGEKAMRKKKRVRDGEKKERLRDVGRAGWNGRNEEESWKRKARIQRNGKGREGGKKKGMGRLAKLFRSMRLR